MSDFEQHELGFPGVRRANLKLRRGIYLLPSSMTVANMLCGFYAVMATLKGGGTDLDNAAKAIGLAILFDSFDGFVARATGTSSEFGKQFDSLADMVSFGIAPGGAGLHLGGARHCRNRLAGYPALARDRLVGGAYLCDLLRLAPGPVQYSGNGARNRIKIFRWAAVPGRRRADCRHGARD